MKLFESGILVTTPAARELLQELNLSSASYLDRHRLGDWGELDVDDKRANDEALKTGGRIFSAYDLPNKDRLWIITEATGDGGRRASTCVLLPEDY